MTRFPEQFAPSWLPRQQRRWINTRLRKLFHSDVCSICGSSFKHNTRTAGGLDSQGNVVLAGECCISRVAKIFTEGFYSHRGYDFLQPRDTGPSTNTELTSEQITDAIVAYQKAISESDKAVDSVEQRGGGAGIILQVSMLDHPWKSDDRDWFERNQKRSHRVRLPFPGECDAEIAKTPAGHTLMLLVRQVEPGRRIRAAISISDNLLPVSDGEAVAHTLFEVGMQREAMPFDRQALLTLIEKYSVCTGSGHE